MPGIKSIVWSDANDSRMLRALLVVANVQITSQAAELIAAYMGMLRISSKDDFM